VESVKIGAFVPLSDWEHITGLSDLAENNCPCLCWPMVGISGAPTASRGWPIAQGSTLPPMAATLAAGNTLTNNTTMKPELSITDLHNEIQNLYAELTRKQELIDWLQGEREALRIYANKLEDQIKQATP
jgi:hypothetical protein